MLRAWRRRIWLPAVYRLRSGQFLGRDGAGWGSWAPRIAGLRRSTLGGRSPYAEVVEEFDLHITGTSAANALANLATLGTLLDNAERWWRGENRAQVTLRYSPEGATVSSTTDPLEAVVLGRATGDQSAGVTLPVVFNEFVPQQWVIRARVRFVRRGLWTRNSIGYSGSSTGSNPAVIQNTFSISSPCIPQPFKIKICAHA